jgi:hypothetical protein
MLGQNHFAEPNMHDVLTFLHPNGFNVQDRSHAELSTTGDGCSQNQTKSMELEKHLDVIMGKEKKKKRRFQTDEDC